MMSQLYGGEQAPAIGVWSWSEVLVSEAITTNLSDLITWPWVIERKNTVDVLVSTVFK